MTQKQIVERELKSQGFITNKWAWQNGIWRLASVISLMRKQGWEIETQEKTDGVKNCKYIWKGSEKKIEKNNEDYLWQ